MLGTATKSEQDALIEQMNAEIARLRERCANWRRLAEAMEALAVAWKEEPKDPSLMEDWRSETLRPAQAAVEERLSALREGGEEC